MIIKILLLTAALVVQAHADPDSKTELQPSTQLTVTQLQEINTVLRALDGYQGTDKSGASAPMQYKLGDLRWNISDDEKIIKTILDEVEMGRVALSKEKFPQGTPTPGTPEFNEFVKSDSGYKEFITVYQKRLEEKHSVTLEHLSKKLLNVGDAPDKNPIPPSVISVLDQYGLIDP